MTQPFRLALICGGPSAERGISLNSARSVMDHLQGPMLEIIPLYVDFQKKFYQISPAQLYSNTPADFDFKLHQMATELDDKSLENLLKSVDLTFPLIHGRFGEDGELQTLLESFHVPFIGSSAMACKKMFQKDGASEILRANGFPVMAQTVIPEQEKNPRTIIEQFFSQNNLKRAIVKPSLGGSSIGVHSVHSPEEALIRLEEIFAKKLSSAALIEPFCEGREFTIVVFENLQGEPVALIPTEVELSYEGNEIFDYRKKYLPTNQAAYHTPPRFSQEIVNQIRREAEEIFKLFGMRDFVRLDGWVVNGIDVYFTDMNPLSGLEQNSFFFRQSSLLGLTHRDALEYILKRACQRCHLTFPEVKEIEAPQNDCKSRVFVLFGNNNAERQVSLMSGTNVWLKLLRSNLFAPVPFLVDPCGEIWELPYSFTLNHTVEEIYANCLSAQSLADEWQKLSQSIRRTLGIASAFSLKPSQISLEHFFELAKKERAFVFIAMHGGIGEDGTLQKRLEAHQIPFNGSNSVVSALCMDKYLTGQAIEQLEACGFLTIPRKIVSLSEFEKFTAVEFESLWKEWRLELASTRLIIKPRSDGCSSGIVLLQSSGDLQLYCRFFFEKRKIIPPFSFANQRDPIEMPSLVKHHLLEPYIETDTIAIQQGGLSHTSKEGWIELTAGVLEKEGKYHAMNPSIAIAEGSILSLEEKFQGGTGINLTPPPPEILSPSATLKIRRLVEKASQALGIQNYARLDLFFNLQSEKMILIEANSLPALTPSTVFYHQGLAEESPLTPLALLEKIITAKLANG